MAKNLEEAIQKAGGPVKLLWESKTPPAVVPRVVQEFSNWRDEQLAWRRTAVLFDQSHHMANLNIKGRDALKLISKLAVNSVANFPVDMAKQFVAVNYDGYVIGDNILFQRADSVEAGWQAVQPFLDAWKRAGARGLEAYEAGSEGPARADDLIKRDGRSWRKPRPRALSRESMPIPDASRFA